MNRRQGFTLMELLLVVAVLAIVAAAAAPTFFSGASDAMNEARKSQFMSAFSNATSAANMNAALYASGTKRGADNAIKTDLSVKDLMEGSPLSTRTFQTPKGKFSAVYGFHDHDGEDATNQIKIYYTTLTNDAPTEAAEAGTDEIKASELNKFWDENFAEK